MATKTISTASQLQRIRPPAAGRDEYAVAKAPGLRLRVSAAGKFEWSGIARLHGKQLRFLLGSYATSEGGLGLADARRRWEEWRQQIAVGDDPRPAARAKPILTDPLVPDCRLAGELGISRLTVWRWRERGILPAAVVIAGRNFTRLSAVEHLKEHGDGSLPQKVPTPAPAPPPPRPTRRSKAIA